MIKVPYSIGYAEGQAGMLAAMISNLDTRIDILVDQQSIFKKGGAKKQFEIWDAKIDELNSFRDDVLQAHARIVKVAAWTKRLPLDRTSHSTNLSPSPSTIGETIIKV